MLEAFKNPDTEDKEKIRNALIRNYGSSLTNLKVELQSLKEEFKDKKFILESLQEDINMDTNTHTIRVHHTHSGVELVHICSNDNGKELWKSLKMPQLLSKIVYWHFIVPILRTVRENVGCKYVFLFAADDSKDQTLINHNQVSFGLQIPTDIGTSKPFYDFNCTFMCREINEIVKEVHKFYEEFNNDKFEVTE